jgi:hypothetical protein
VNTPSGEDPLLFQRGEIIRGTVIDPVDSRHALIRIKGEEILVENRGVSLTRDRGILFQVEETHPQVILKIVPEETSPGLEIESFIQKYFSSDSTLETLTERLSGLGKVAVETRDPEVRETLDQLFSLLSRFSLPAFSSDPTNLQRIVAQSGLFWEAKLKHFIEGRTKDSFDFIQGDLKSLLLKLKSQLNSLVGQNKIAESTSLEELIKGLGQFVDKIGLYQLLNIYQTDPQGNLFLFFPLWAQNHLQFVELNFSSPRQRGRAPGKEGLSILFLLHLPDWGRMRIEAKVRGKGLYCSFTVSNPEVKEVLSQALPELSQKLNQAGYEPFFHTFVESVEKIGQSLIPDINQWVDSLLNIMV